MIALAATQLFSCSDHVLQLGTRQEAIIECNGGSVGQACDTDDDLCTQEVCVLVGQNVMCQQQSLAPDNTVCLSDGLPCTADTCQSGECQHISLPSGTLCDDGLFCTSGDFCSATGQCGGGIANCDDGNSCTSDSCDEASDSCESSVMVGASCNDNNACTTGETCDGNGQCLGATPAFCDDGSDCTDDSCDQNTGCVFDITPDSSCSDTFFCTIGEICGGDGSCQGVANCNDGNQCTTDSCDELGAACSNIIALGQDCNDSNECTEIDVCDELGDCVGIPVADGALCGSSGGCSLGGLCQNGSCVGTMDEADNTPCNDSDVCTMSDSCQSGSCTGYPINCSDDNPCTADGCDSLSGCFNEVIEGCQMIPDAGIPDAGIGFDAGTFPDANLADASPENEDSGTNPDAADSVLGGGGCNSTAADQSAKWVVLLLAFGLLVHRFRNSRAVLGALFLVILLEQLARAEGFDSELFKPATSQTSFFSQSSAEVLPSGSYHFNVGLHLSTSPLVLRDALSGEKIPNGELVSQRTGAYLSGAIGLLRRYEFGIALPLVLSQDGSGMMLVGNPDLSAASVGDLRVEFKASLWKTQTIHLATNLTSTLPLGDENALFGESRFTLTPRIILSSHLGPFHVGLNLGMRFREKGEVASLRINDEITGGIAVQYSLIEANLWLLAELYANRSMHTSQSEAFPAETIAGVRVQLSGPWQLQAGAGAGLGPGYGTPAFRGLIGFSYAPQEKGAQRINVPPVKASAPKSPPKAKTKGTKKEPEIDNDKDGLLPPNDQCPDDAEDMDGFEDEDGCPDLDNDNDGIADTDDACPLKPETVNGVDDEDGCPDEGIITMKADRIVLEDTVLFDRNRSRVKRRGKKALRAIVALYRQHPEWGLIRIHGFTDADGPRDYNLELSQRRAARVRDEMIILGIDAATISSDGFGESKLVVRGSSESARQRNRRVEFIIEIPAQ